MAVITYNGIQSPQNMITFSDVPNILSIAENINGTKAMVTITIDNDLDGEVDSDGQFYLTFLAETIVSTTSPSSAKNKRFYIGDANSTCASMVQALRNCPSIEVEYNIINSGDTVILLAKTIGTKFQGLSRVIETNIPNDFISVETVDGSASSNLLNSKINVDIYGGEQSADTYITTLSKYFWNKECAFDVSPVLATHSEYGKLQPYSFKISRISPSGAYSYLGVASGSTTIGFEANQSERWLYNTNDVIFLMNKERSIKGDGTILYVADNYIPYTLLSNGRSTWTLTVTCKDSAGQTIYTATHGIRLNLNGITDGGITVPQSAFTQAYTVTLDVNTDSVTFHVIKPLNASEGVQRVYWRNEYGGISFFDFTSSKVATDTLDIETYEKNLFDYYVTDLIEKRKIYSNKYSKKVKLTSHLMEEDGKWVFNSLAKSKSIWTEVNGQTYSIIPTAIEVVEQEGYNNIYTATLTYEYSALDD